MTIVLPVIVFAILAVGILLKRYDTLVSFFEKSWGRVPGNTPAFFTSDPHKDMFRLLKLELIPNPPKEQYEFELRFTGVFHEAPGDSARIKIKSWRDKKVNFDFVAHLNEMEITQDGKRTYDPKAGPVVISFKSYLLGSVPTDYSVRAQAYAVDGRSIFSIGVDVEKKQEIVQQV